MMRRTRLIALAAALPLVAVASAWAAPAPLSDAAQKIAAALGPEWTFKGSGPSGAPPGWTGETKSENLVAVRKFPEQAVEERLEIWLCPAAYNGEVLPCRAGRGDKPWLLAAGDERLMFVRLRHFDVGYAPVKVGLDAVTEKLGLKPATDRERTPAAAKADPRAAAKHKAWSEKTKAAVAKLEAGMQMNIAYTGPQPNGNPYLTLNLNMWVIMPPNIFPNWELVYVPKWYSLQWLYWLADDGYFDRAVQEDRAVRGDPERGRPKYSLCLSGNGVDWEEDLGWNAETGKRLDVLRKEMVGDAATVMDLLLKRLEADRKAWDKAPAAAPAPLSDAAQKIAAAAGPNLVLKKSGPCAAPPGWSGETKGEYMAFFAPDENPDKDASPKLEMWLAPADYKGDQLPARLGGIDTWTPALYAVGPKHLLFLSAVQVEGEEGIAQLFPTLRKVLKESMGLEKAEDPERTPASVKADPAKPAGEGWSPKTRKAVEALWGQRAWIYIEYSPMQFGLEQRSIRFVLSQIPSPDAMYPGPDIYLPRLWRDRLIATLADNGFFDRATTSEQAYRAWPQRQGYVAKVQAVEKSQGVGLYAEYLGWNAETGKHLDALRKGMTGDAAKAMDQLLKQLEPDRKEWENAAKTGASK
jgi:hypothetical protein